MVTSEDPPKDLMADVAATARTMRVAKRLSFVAGVAAILAAAFFNPILGKFARIFRDHGFDTSDVLSPFAMALLANHGILPTGILGVAGVAAVAASFSGRRNLMLAAGFTALVMVAAAGTAIPIVLAEAQGNAVGGK